MSMPDPLARLIAERFVDMLFGGPGSDRPGILPIPHVPDPPRDPVPLTRQLRRWRARKGERRAP